MRKNPQKSTSSSFSSQRRNPSKRTRNHAKTSVQKSSQQQHFPSLGEAYGNEHKKSTAPNKHQSYI